MYIDLSLFIYTCSMSSILILFRHNQLLSNPYKTIKIYSQDIGIEFGIKKFAMLIMKKKMEKEKQ